MAVSSNRRVWRRPYAFEIFTPLNFLGIVALTAGESMATVRTMPLVFLTLVPTFLIQCAGGIIARLLVGWYRGTTRSYLKVLRSSGWLTDTVRMILFSVFMAHTYGWIKLTVPLLHPRFFDQELWDIDRVLFFGLSPNIFFLNLFSQPMALGAIDQLYTRIFFGSMFLANAFFLSSPSRRLRTAFLNGNTLLWLGGAWLYMLVPSLGPAYRFPEVWLQYSKSLDRTQYFQRMLMTNFQKVLRIRSNARENINIFLGIGAFPSLHVAFQTFVALWMRRLWIYGQIVFGVFAFVILLGSVVTGWHYLIDAYAGIVLALIAYWSTSRPARIRRWAQLMEVKSLSPSSH